MMRNPTATMDALSQKVATIADGPGISNYETTNLVPGAPVVTLSGGLYRAVNNNYGRSKPIGLVSVLALPTLSTAVAIDGWLTLTAAQWDAVTGDSGGLIPGAEYFVDSTPGTLTTTPPTSSGSVVASVGHAVGTLNMRVRIGTFVLL